MALVWAPEEARTADFAAALGARLHHVHYLLYKRPWNAPLKYVLQAARTLEILVRERPKLVFVTNPPIFAAVCAAFYGRATHTPFVMDTHPPALYSRRWRWTVPLQRAVARRALVNVVDQERFRTLFESWGAPAIVIEHLRRPAGLPPAGPRDARRPFEVLVVNTFAPDEPIEPVLEAAARLPEVAFAVTGDVRRMPPGLRGRAPANVEWTGYLQGAAYSIRLARARVVMVLTTYPHSLLGGAQEAVAARTPLILSDQPALRGYFTVGAVFVENTADGLVAGVRRARENEERLLREVLELAESHRRGAEQRLAALLQRMERAGVAVPGDSR